MFRTPLPSDHHLKVSKHGTTMVVRFGKWNTLDAFAVNAIGLELFGVADRNDVHCLILDFSSVNRLPSLLLGEILMLRSEMEAQGKVLVLCNLAPETEWLFSITNLNRVLDIKGSVDDALKSLGATPWRLPMPSTRPGYRMRGLLTG